MTIEEVWLEADNVHWWSLRAMDNEDIGNVVDERITVRNVALTVLDEVEGMALASSDIAVNDHFVEDVLTPLRARIEALGRN